MGLQVLPPEKYGEAATVFFCTFDAPNDDDFSGAVDWAQEGTIQISKDGGTFNACTNSPTEITSGYHSLVLTATEMEAAKVLIRIIDDSAGATGPFSDVGLQIPTYGNASASVPGDVSRIDKVLQVILGIVVRR